MLFMEIMKHKLVYILFYSILLHKTEYVEVKISKI